MNIATANIALLEIMANHIMFNTIAYRTMCEGLVTTAFTGPQSADFARECRAARSVLAIVANTFDPTRCAEDTIHATSHVIVAPAVLSRAIYNMATDIINNFNAIITFQIMIGQGNATHPLEYILYCLRTMAGGSVAAIDALGFGIRGIRQRFLSMSTSQATTTIAPF